MSKEGKILKLQKGKFSKIFAITHNIKENLFVMYSPMIIDAFLSFSTHYLSPGF